MTDRRQYRSLPPAASIDRPEGGRPTIHAMAADASPGRARALAVVEPLEQRLLYTADAPAPVQGAASIVAAVVTSLAPPSDVTATPQTPHAAESTQGGAPRELVVLDASVPDQEQLLEDLSSQRNTGRNIDLLLIDDDQDAMASLSAALDGSQYYAAVHLIGHGEAGQMRLGSTVLDASSVRLQADRIAGWTAGLAPGADLLLYGCDVAASRDGLALIESLASLTGADVAASDDATGARAIGGDWMLERQTGTIEASVAIDASGQAS